MHRNRYLELTPGRKVWPIQALLCLCLCAALLGYAPAARAHKVTIFAWVEGDTVHTQSKFSGGKRVQEGTVVVYDKEGNLLLEGKTDAQGEFSFKAPRKAELLVALKATMGHLAEWKIPAEEFEASGKSGQGDVAPAPAEAPPQDLPAPSSSENQEPASPVVDSKELGRIVETAVERKLEPIRQMLVDSMDKGPGMTEIFGGIGYIVGLVSIGLYFSGRGKR